MVYNRVMEPDKLEKLTLLKFKIAYFIAAHKIFLKRLVIFIVILGCLGLYGYSAYHLTDYLLRTGEFEKMLQSLVKVSVNYQDYRLRHEPRSLIILKQAAIPGLGKRHDFVAQVKNPNEDWLVERIRYRFQWEGGMTETAEDIVLPHDETYLLLLNSETVSQLPQPRLEFLDIDWKRVRKPFNVQKSDFIVSDKKFVSPLDLELRDSTGVPARVVFKVRNNTFYSFWEANFKVILERGSDIIATQHSFASQFRAGETITQEVAWLESVSVPTNIIIEPAIDFLHSENFMPPESSRGELK